MPLERSHDEAEIRAGEAPARVATAARGAASPRSFVLGLQRSCGNAATRALLRQLHEAGHQTAPTRIDRHDPIITTVFGPVLHERGRYEWRVDFQLPHPAERDGFLIQELYQEASGAQEHNGVRGLLQWECWRIRRGEREPADRINGAHDRYRILYPGEGPASGWNRHVGVIRFHPGPLPSEFGAEQAGANHYSTTTRPSVWTGQGTRHDAYSEWDSRGSAPYNGLVTYAGDVVTHVGDRITFRPRQPVTP